MRTDEEKLLALADAKAKELGFELVYHYVNNEHSGPGLRMQFDVSANSFGGVGSWVWYRQRETAQKAWQRIEADLVRKVQR